MDKKFSIAIKLVNVSPAHVRFTLFANMIPANQDHEQATRASLGSQLTLRNEEFPHFVNRLQPHVITGSKQSWEQLYDESISQQFDLNNCTIFMV